MSCFFHHKSSVRTITDTHSALRDNEDRIEESSSVPVSRDGHRSRHGSILGSSLTNKSSKIA
jgi:hypothetical protein